jgi:hypothetical protein
MERYSENPSKFRLSVRPGLGAVLRKGPCSPPSDRVTGSDNHINSPDEDNLETVRQRTFTRAKDSIRIRKESTGSSIVPEISITDESDSNLESIRASSSSRPFQTTEQKTPACIDYLTGESVCENIGHLDSTLKLGIDADDGPRLDVSEVSPDSVKANGGGTVGGAQPSRTSKKVPIVTSEMLQKHSYHYYLMHNFFLSDSSSSSNSEDSGADISQTTPVKKVTFKLEPEYIPSEPTVPRSAQCSCNQRNPVRYAYIQVAGTMFQTHWTTLDRHPDTLLGGPDKFQYFDYTREVFSFPHIRQDCFESILFYYQDGILRSPKGVKEEVFLAELDFFGIRHDKITVGPYEHEQ